MKSYELQGDGPLLHDGKNYEPGDTVEMDEAAAKARVESGRLTEPGHGSGDGDPDAAIQEAIGQLEDGNPDHWTKGGKPEVKAIETIVGFQLTAAERDAAWEAFQASFRTGMT